MDTTLWKLAAEFRSAADQMLDMDLPQEVITDTLEGMSLPFNDKVENVAKMVRHFEAMVEAAKREQAAMAARKNMFEGRANGLKKYIYDCLKTALITKVEGDSYTISIKLGKDKVVVEDESKLTLDYWRFPDPPPREVDKAKIFSDIKAGVIVVGARLDKSDHLEIK